MSKVFYGCGTALITPFRQDGFFDEPTFRKLVQRQVSEGIDYLVPCGTTGESPALSHSEKLAVVRACVEESGGKPVLAGAGGPNTAEIIELIHEYAELGVTGILSVTPYYNKPTQLGLLAHYKAIASSTPLPIIVYSVQPRTNVNIEPGTMARLAEIPNIIGVKEASGSLAQVASIIHRVPEDFLVISGDDSVTLAVIALGGKGLISVASNEIPGPMTELTRLALNGDFAGARTVQRRYQDLMEANFIEASPQPCKAAMELMGLHSGAIRLPLIKAQSETYDRMESILTEAGLI